MNRETKTNFDKKI